MRHLKHARGERRRHRFVAMVEVMERLCLLSDVTMLSVTQISGNTLSFDYGVQVSGISSLEVDFYRSATPTFSAAADVKIGSTKLSGSELSTGTHDDVTAILSAPLPSGAAALSPDPAHPFVFAVATGPDNVTTDASYQTFILGAVTHGFTFPPTIANDPSIWVKQMAASLRADGYNKTIAFGWTSTSSLPFQGEATRAGNRLAKQIETFLEKPGDVPGGAVVDLHLIGHSRGSVVVTQAFQDLQNDLSQIPQAAGGYWLLTYLDPHPAHGTNVGQFGVPGNVAGTLALKGANAFQRHTKDPLLFVPAHVTEVQDYWEHTPSSQTPSFSGERLITPWGLSPGEGITILDPTTTTLHEQQLTAPGIGHTEVHVWYQDNVVPLLETATPFITGPVDAPIAASSTMVSLGSGYHELIVHVTDDDPTSTSSDFTATVQWGDGTESQETLSGTDLIGYFIHDHHRYSGDGPFTYAVTIKDIGGATTKTSGKVS